VLNANLAVAQSALVGRTTDGDEGVPAAGLLFGTCANLFLRWCD
jgi:hypothetical protein